MKKKVIILYSTAGMGHKKAAIAIYNEMKDRDLDLDIEIIDVFDYATDFYKFLYMDFYVYVTTHAKWFWKGLYYFSNIPVVDFLTRKIRGIVDYLSLPGLGKMFEEKNVDAVIATHFILPSIAWILKQKKGFHAKLYTLMTDYGPHSCWYSSNIKKFFTGSKFAASELAKKGIKREHIIATGIPTSKEFSDSYNMEEIRKEYGLDPDKKTILIMSGGFGIGPVAEMLLSLNSCRSDFQVITICGHNEALHEQVKDIQEKLNYRMLLIGFTDKVAEFMAASDLMVSKAGGISVTEAMNSRLPMVLFASIPGQETWNEEFLQHKKAAVKALKVTDIPVSVDKIFSSEAYYNSLLRAIDRIRHPDAAKRIVNIVLNGIGGLIGEDDGKQ